MAMTKKERQILAFVVTDPDAWFAHAVRTFGEARAHEALRSKVERHAPAHKAAAEAGQPKTRKERDAAEEAAQAALEAKVAADA